MNNFQIYNLNSFLAMKRLINMLIKKDALTSKKMDQLLLIGTARGFSNKMILETVMDCQIEFRVD
ncbi:MAG: hypothetical protein AAFQ94_13400 [Bacteroidota bacterium]